jgi:hypothetical protein
MIIRAACYYKRTGIFSVSKGRKHIHIRYFFATDKIAKKELKLIYCPTDKMIADYSTKLLQGAKFVEFRDQMQGISAKYYDDYKRQYMAVLKSIYGGFPLIPNVSRRCAIAQNSLKY